MAKILVAVFLILSFTPLNCKSYGFDCEKVAKDFRASGIDAKCIDTAKLQRF